LGEPDQARTIYDSFLERFADSDHPTLAQNMVITYSNYALIELIFGDIHKAKELIDQSFVGTKALNIERQIPFLMTTMGVIYARCGMIHRGAEFAIEGLKPTYWRGSSREGQISIEWASGVLTTAGLRREAWNFMNWVKFWRKRTSHPRSVAEERYAQSLDLDEFRGSVPLFNETEEYRTIMGLLIKALRRVQSDTLS
jgi:hypothetical protein